MQSRWLQKSRPLLQLIRKSSMSSSACIIPHDPLNPSKAVSGVESVDLWHSAVSSVKTPQVGTTRIFYNTPASKITALSSLGEEFPSQEGNSRRELVRRSVGSAVKAVKALESVQEISVEASLDPQAAGMLDCIARYSTKTYLQSSGCRKFGCIPVFFENVPSARKDTV